MKKVILSYLLSIYLNSHAQKIALLNVDFKQPIIYTDSVTAEQSRSFFPVKIENFDTLYADLNYIKEMLKTRQRAKMESFELRAGPTILDIHRVLFAYGDRYIVKAKTKIGELESGLILTDYKKSNAHNASRVEKMMAYMQSNKALFRSANEIQPKLYNMVIVSD